MKKVERRVKKLIADIKGTKFYTYRQNNSGGSFVENDKVGVYVIIEATNSAEADEKAEKIGLYFDGVESGEDCECCGDRWHDSPEVYLKPAAYGIPVSKLKATFGGTAKIHRIDGTIETVELEAGRNDDQNYDEVPRVNAD